MSVGTIYYYPKSPRGQILLALSKSLKIDIKFVDAKVASEEFAELFPLKKTPAFVGANGYKLTESCAIAEYCMLH